MNDSKYTDYQTHESYGLAKFVRTQSSHAHNLFGSSITHKDTIHLSISKGSVKRDLHREWFIDENEIVEVELSENQFAELITTMNIGTGIPCTIKHLNGKSMSAPPYENQRQLFEKEFKADIKKIGADLNSLVTELHKLIEEKAPRSAYKELLSKVRMVSQDVNANLPFVQKSFNEAMDKTVTEAKGEIEAFVLNKILTLGIESLKNQTPMIEGDQNDHNQIPKPN